MLCTLFKDSAILAIERSLRFPNLDICLDCEGRWNTGGRLSLEIGKFSATLKSLLNCSACMATGDFAVILQDSLAMGGLELIGASHPAE